MWVWGTGMNYSGRNAVHICPKIAQNGLKRPYIAPDRLKKGSKRAKKWVKSGQKPFKSDVDLHKSA